MNILSRKEAKEQGLKYYFTGEPCKHGHLAEKFVSNGTCLVCTRKQAYGWAKENKDKVIENKKRYRKKYKDKEKIAKKLWAQNNKARRTAAQSRREAAKKQRTPTWANEQDILSWYEVAEVLSRSGVKFHVDHVVPLQGKIVSGFHVENNMQILPAYINISKNNQWNWEIQSHE